LASSFRPTSLGKRSDLSRCPIGGLPDWCQAAVLHSKLQAVFASRAVVRCAVIPARRSGPSLRANTRPDDPFAWVSNARTFFCDLLDAMSYDSRADAARAVPRPAFARTAGPSTTLLRSSGRDDKGKRVAQVGVVAGWEETCPATTLLRKNLRESQGTLQIPPVGRDDKRRGVIQVGVVAGWEETRSCDYASLEGFARVAGHTADPSRWSE
jgi:hypothetical protein